MEQYNALLRAAPLLERELAKAGETVSRPVYDGAGDGVGMEGEAEGEGGGAEDDGEEEDEKEG